MMKMMITCEKASFLIDKSYYTPLTLKERFDLKIHLLTCKFCRIYSHESHLINEEIKKIKIQNMNYKLTEEQKKKIIDKIP